MTLVTFGFSIPLLLLLSEARNFLGVVTFGWLKRVLYMGTSQNKVAKNVKEILLKKGNVYPKL